MIKRCLTKAAVISAILFIACIVVFAGVSFALGELMEPNVVFNMLVMSAVIGVINFSRFMLEPTRWAMSKPAVVKNLIFMPAYYVVAMVFVYLNVGWIDWKFFAVYSLLFVAVFAVAQTVRYFIAKADTDKMNDALIEFGKEHFGDEQE